MTKRVRPMQRTRQAPTLSGHMTAMACLLLDLMPTMLSGRVLTERQPHKPSPGRATPRVVAEPGHTAPRQRALIFEDEVAATPLTTGHHMHPGRRQGKRHARPLLQHLNGGVTCPPPHPALPRLAPTRRAKRRVAQLSRVVWLRSFPPWRPPHRSLSAPGARP